VSQRADREDLSRHAAAVTATQDAAIVALTDAAIEARHLAKQVRRMGTTDHLSAARPSFEVAARDAMTAIENLWTALHDAATAAGEDA
jgi:hypothetical protein